MKNRVEKGLRGLLLILAAVFMMSLSTAFAQDTRTKMASYTSVDINENFDMLLASMDAANPGMEKNDTDLLNELSQPDTSYQADRTGNEESCGNYECLLTTPR